MRLTLFYIDPGTGSMLFTILIGVLGAAIYALRSSFLKLKFRISGGKAAKEALDRVPFAIFSDSKRYWNVFGPICEELERRGEAAEYLTASPDDPALSRHFEHITCKFLGEGNQAFAALNQLRADVVLSTTPSLDVFQWKRSKDVRFYAHILHMVNDATLYRMFGLDYYDAVLLNGDYQVAQLRKLEALRGLPEKELLVVGQPYLDSMRQRLAALPPPADHETTVLLAPSWGPSSILNRYGAKAIDALLATGYHVIVRPHPQSFTSEKALMDELMAKYPDNAQLEWNRDNDNFDVLRRSDVLISDFSGVIFDFSLVFDKPVIYADTSMDLAPYDACWLDEPLWTFEILPRIGVQLTEDRLDELKAVIDACLTEPRFAEGRDQARREAWANAGHSAEKTVDYLLSVRDRLAAKEAAQ